MTGYVSPASVLRSWRSQPVRVLNLGCGSRTSDHPGVLNVDWSPLLRLRRWRVSDQLALHFLPGRYKERYRGLPPNVLACDLSRGLPFADASVDVIYHSHMLEHLPREVAPSFFREVHRVLKPGGFHRIVVPDLQLLARRYLESFQRGPRAVAPGTHEKAIEDLLEQSVRQVPAGLSVLKGWRLWAAMVLFGDARKRGEVHLWMYDSINLKALLDSTGFQDVQIQGFDSSANPMWREFGMDYWSRLDPPPDSLYMEARRA